MSIDARRAEAPAAPSHDALAGVRISAAARRERHGRGVTMHGVHVWWARRPHSAMRSLIFAALMRGDDVALGERIAELRPDAPALELARQRLQGRFGRAPRVLDMFGGGGTIACEAINLGADACSIDVHPLSVYVQRALLDYPHRAGCADLAGAVHASGRRVLRALESRTHELYPLRAAAARGAGAGHPAPLAYLWTYAMRCSACGFRFSLSRRPWLSRRNGRRVALRAERSDDAEELVIEDPAGETRPAGAWAGRARGPVCPRCEAVQPRPDATACEDRLAALVLPAARGGKTFAPATAAAAATPALLARREAEALHALGASLPQSRLPRWSGIVNPPLYGIERHADIFSPRQRVTALTLLGAILDEHRLLVRAHGEARARAVTAMLSALVDQLVDWNCRLSMWIAQNEQIGRAFCGPGVAMLWDYAEMDPCQRGPANLWSKLERIVAGCRQVETLPAPARIELADATRLPFADASFDAVVTDPPYYDNLSHAALAECFLAWKAPLVRVLDPALLAPGRAGVELIASARICPPDGDPHEHYCARLERALAEAARVLAPGGSCALVYAHASLSGWEALLRALRGARLYAHGVLPLAVERRRRPRSMHGRALNSCLAFMLRRAPPPALAAAAAAVPGAVAELAAGSLADGLAAADWD
ncbi:MAG: DUF1156 domain-containing protein, partial [Burkholderiales bacterium]|nr:DUF1156 domain-containing protein [Burkholderiales bacterium]